MVVSRDSRDPLLVGSESTNDDHRLVNSRLFFQIVEFTSTHVPHVGHRYDDEMSDEVVLQAHSISNSRRLCLSYPHRPWMRPIPTQ